MAGRYGDSTLDSSVNWKKYPKNRQKEFLNALSQKQGTEKTVEAAWDAVLTYSFVEPNLQYATTSKKLDTDGLIMVSDITVAMSLITEYKDDVDLDKRTFQERILAQVIFYLKKIQHHIEAGNDLHIIMPNVVLAADKNQAFVINARVLYDYLDLPGVDWSQPARHAYDALEPQIIFDTLRQDNNINPYIYDVRAKDFDLNDVLGLVADLAGTSNADDLKKIPVNQANIRGAYDEFLRLVTQDKTKVSTNQELVAMFINALTNHENLAVKNNEVTLLRDNGTYSKYRVNGRNWYAFFSRFDTNYSAREIKDITEVGDVLLKETSRRKSGEYWTPTQWASEAVNEISKTLGDDWIEKYTVWDAAAGSKNLTRDFHFSKLFSSTLFEHELDLGRSYNKNNVTFQYDFLNDDVDLNPNNIETSKLNKIAPELAKSIQKDEPIVLYMNPPYGTAGDLRMDAKNKKAGIAKTTVNSAMKLDKMGQASENLYAQFFWRAVEIKRQFNLTNMVIAFFTNSQYMAGGSYYGKLANKIFSNFSYQSGFLLNSGEFNDTSSSWAISFVVLTSISEDISNVPDHFDLAVKELIPGSGIVISGTHSIEKLSKKEFLSEWVRQGTPKDANWLTKETYPTFSSAFAIKDTGANSSKMASNGLGYAWNKGNNVEKARTETAIFTGAFRDGHGFPIFPENFERVILNFAIRKATEHSWITGKDNYRKPSSNFLTSDAYNSVITDSVVYSLFNTFSYQVSLDNIEYAGKMYTINNEFFWLSKDRMLRLADKYKYEEMGFQIEDSNERFVYLWIEGHKQYLSDESKEVLRLATFIVLDTFSERHAVNEDYPDYSLMRWDAGWEQIRRLINNGKPNVTYDKEFKSAYKKLENKINEYIYRFGFLRK